MFGLVNLHHTGRNRTLSYRDLEIRILCKFEKMFHAVDSGFVSCQVSRNCVILGFQNLFFAKTTCSTDKISTKTVYVIDKKIICCCPCSTNLLHMPNKYIEQSNCFKSKISNRTEKSALHTYNTTSCAHYKLVWGNHVHSSKTIVKMLAANIRLRVQKSCVHDTGK